MPIIAGNKTYAERLEDVGWFVAPDGCWIWRGDFYGSRAKLHHGGVSVNASKAMWEAHYGPVHELLEVCHSCHNGRCVNINHLYLANHARNMADSGDSAPSLPFANFKAAPAQRRALSENDRRRAVALHSTRMMLVRELAMLFDVTEKTMREALKDS